MTTPLAADLADIVSTRRLASEQQAKTRAHFTVAKTAALLRLRSLERETEWDWTIALLRVANLLSDAAVAVFAQREEQEQRITEVALALPDADFEGLTVSNVLAAALEPDLGPPIDRVARIRAQLGRAINRALSTRPERLELITPVGVRTYIRNEHAEQGDDPYTLGPALPGEGDDRIVVRHVANRPSAARRFTAWIRGRSEAERVVSERWLEVLVGERSVDESRTARAGPTAGAGMPTAASRAGEGIALGEHAHFFPNQEERGLFLTRDGVRIIDIWPALSKTEGIDQPLNGTVECPSLRLTVDEDAAAQDASWDLLVAWFCDLSARDFSVERAGKVKWPSRLSGVATATGHVLSFEQLGRRTKEGRDLLFVWAHQVSLVPSSIRARVLQLWPSELVLLQAALPDARVVPLRALGAEPEYDRVDLTSLRQGSLDPLRLIADAEVDRGGETLLLDVVAYVHRYPTAAEGSIAILAYERRVSYIRDQRRSVPGLTLLCRVRPKTGQVGPPLDALREDVDFLEAVASRALGLANGNLEHLLAHVRREANPWENPLVRAVVSDLNAVRLGIRYSLQDGALLLAWDESVLLDVEIGRGGPRQRDVRTLRDGLTRLRTLGYLPVGKRWRTLETSPDDDDPWVLSSHADELFGRTLGRAAVLDMPAVVEAYPRPKPAAKQRHLLQSRDEIGKDIERSSTDPRARMRLLGHLLVARADGKDELGLADVPLMLRYDPRALAPSRLVSLAAVLRERPGLAYPGAVSRELAGPVVEVVPGVAALLHEVCGLSPEPAPVPEASLSGVGVVPGGPLRKRGRDVPPLVQDAVVHPMLVGSLRIAGDGSSNGVALWRDGLRVGEVTLPEPLGRVSGRLWLSQRTPSDAVKKVVYELARDLMRTVMRQRVMLPPGDRRDKLEAFITYARKVADEDQDLELRAILGRPESGRSAESTLDTSLRSMPLRPLGDKPALWLSDVIRQSIGLPIRVSTALLSKKICSVERVRSDGTVEIEFGRRNPWIVAAMQDGSGIDAPFQAGALVLAEFFRQVKERNLIDVDPAYEAVAYWRLLALLFQQVG